MQVAGAPPGDPAKESFVAIHPKRVDSELELPGEAIGFPPQGSSKRLAPEATTPHAANKRSPHAANRSGVIVGKCYPSWGDSKKADNHLLDGRSSMQTARQPIVDLIYEVIAATPPIQLDGSHDMQKARLANQLLNEGYLDGEPSVDIEGRPGLITILDVTIKGRQLCDQLEQDIRNDRPLVKAGQALKKGTVLLLGGMAGIIGGVIGAVITEFVLRSLKWK